MQLLVLWRLRLLFDLFHQRRRRKKKKELNVKRGRTRCSKISSRRSFLIHDSFFCMHYYIQRYERKKCWKWLSNWKVSGLEWWHKVRKKREWWLDTNCFEAFDEYTDVCRCLSGYWVCSSWFSVSTFSSVIVLFMIFIWKFNFGWALPSDWFSFS